MRIIDFKNITVLRDNQRILDSLDLHIIAGESTAVLGPNGAGKSTLLKLMTREIYPVQADGRIFKIWGQDNWDLHALRDRLGIVSDSISSLARPDCTCMDIVVSGFFGAMGMYNEHATRQMIKASEDALEFMEVLQLKQRRISTLSTGEARRVFIARTLAHRPKALILDEPTNSLDIHAVQKFRKVISKIAASGVTVVIATHTLQDIIPEVKRVVFLRHGRMAGCGRKQEMLTDKKLSELFGCGVRVVENRGVYTCVE